MLGSVLSTHFSQSFSGGVPLFDTPPSVRWKAWLRKFIVPGLSRRSPEGEGGKPRASPLWQCLTRHFDRFQAVYEERYQPRHGYLRPIIPEVVNKFMDCGDLERGFARIRCDHCQKDHLLAFSCKGRWFCPSCHQKKVQLFGALLTETLLFPVPHRHVTLTIPKMLRPYFRYHRDLLKDLCRIAHECVRDVMRISLDQPEGMPGIVMAIHTFGEYLDFHPHLHLLMADGLFLRDERFLVLPENGMDAVEELFLATDGTVWYVDTVPDAMEPVPGETPDIPAFGRVKHIVSGSGGFMLAVRDDDTL
jgi:hypothetical protein